MDHSLAMFPEEFKLAFAKGLNNEKIPGVAVIIIKDGRGLFQKGLA